MGMGVLVQVQEEEGDMTVAEEVVSLLGNGEEEIYHPEHQEEDIAGAEEADLGAGKDLVEEFIVGIFRPLEASVSRIWRCHQIPKSHILASQMKGSGN